MNWSDYPIGTRAYAINGGYWIKVSEGWKWFNGSVFPTPGGDFSGKIEVPLRKLEFMTEPETKEMLQTIAKSVDKVCEVLGIEEPLFALVVFNDPKLAHFVSNCDRKSMIEAMRETANRLERKEFYGNLS